MPRRKKEQIIVTYIQNVSFFVTLPSTSKLWGVRNITTLPTARTALVQHRHKGYVGNMKAKTHVMNRSEAKENLPEGKCILISLITGF